MERPEPSVRGSGILRQRWNNAYAVKGSDCSHLSWRKKTSCTSWHSTLCIPLFGFPYVFYGFDIFPWFCHVLSIPTTRFHPATVAWSATPRTASYDLQLGPTSGASSLLGTTLQHCEWTRGGEGLKGPNLVVNINAYQGNIAIIDIKHCYHWCWIDTSIKETLILFINYWLILNR